MKLNLYARVTTAALLAVFTISAWSEQPWYGGAEDVGFAKDLWVAMEQAGLVGENHVETELYVGVHPHGAILGTSLETMTVNGITGTVAVKHSYRGMEISIDKVASDRAAFFEDITVMFQREEGYDTPNQNWFWAKYRVDGSVDATPNGVELAGRIAKGKPKGCIACHRKASGGDFLYIN